MTEDFKLRYSNSQQQKFYILYEESLIYKILTPIKRFNTLQELKDYVKIKYKFFNILKNKKTLKYTIETTYKYVEETQFKKVIV